MQKNDFGNLLENIKNKKPFTCFISKIFRNKTGGERFKSSALHPGHRLKWRSTSAHLPSLCKSKRFGHVDHELSDGHVAHRGGFDRLLPQHDFELME